jgi:hypothetical protein
MKFWFTFFSMLLLAATVQAQVTIDVSGMVLDPNGNPVPNVNIHISTDSVGSTVYYNVVQTDANGNYSDSFDLPSNQTQGALFVSMENCPGLPWENATVYWNPGNNVFLINFLYCDAPACSVDILYSPMGSLSAVAGGVAPYAYIWNTGEITSSIFPNAPGDYCVTITDNQGCEASDCYSIYPDTSCTVAISPDFGANPPTLEAIGSSQNPPYVYQWSTGETTATITPNSMGQYCVTMTDNIGCEASDCFWYSPDSTCNVFIDAVLVQGGTLYQLDAMAGGTAPFTYDWSTGETSSSIVVSQDGTYCVTITDAAGCTATSCISVVFTPVDNYLVAGDIYFSDSINTPFNDLSGQAYLIEYDQMAGTLTAIDSVDFSVNPNSQITYSFGTVPAGQYLVKAAFYPSADVYATNLPTYHDSDLFWNDAMTVNVPYSGNDLYPFDIFMIPGNNPGGPGFIGGLVSQGANLTGDGVSGGGNPLEGVSVLLLDPDGNGVSHTATDINGMFSFDNLAWGTYQVVIEIIGKEQGIKWVTIGPDNPKVENIQFEVNDEDVTTGLKEMEWISDVTLYPNPATDFVNVVLPEGHTDAYELQLINTQGQLIWKGMTRQQTQEINIQHLPGGIYFLQIRNGSQIRMMKLVKE